MFSGCRVSGMEGGTLLLHMAQEKNRRKPVQSPGYHQFPLPPCEAMWPVSDENASVRGRSGPDKGLPAIGVSALAGREGRLRACMRDVKWFLLAFISSQVLNCQLLNRGGPFGVPVSG